MNAYQEVLKKHGITAHLIEQELEDFLEWRKGTYQVIYDRLYNRQFDNSKIEKFIDTSSFTEPQKGLSELLEKFLSSQPLKFKAPNWQEEALKDRIAQEHTPLSQIPGVRQKIKYYLFKTLPKVGRLLIK